MNSEKIDFKIFCLESYKQVHKLSGKKALGIFKEYSVFDYLNSFYDVLHTTGQKHIIQDIDEFIEKRQQIKRN
jgi:hypothetical protein